ncbi:MAG: hypothetical protein R3B99_32295 [Polyangiales bacterium]
MARGLASLVMIQGHAYHGWVAPEHHDAAYAFTRVLGTFALAGLPRARRRRDDAAPRERRTTKQTRRSCETLMRRGAQLVVIGYAVQRGVRSSTVPRAFTRGFAPTCFT